MKKACPYNFWSIKFRFSICFLDEQRRYASRYAAKNKILHLEEMANSEPDNPHAQAEYMKVLFSCIIFNANLRLT